MTLREIAEQTSLSLSGLGLDAVSLLMALAEVESGKKGRGPKLLLSHAPGGKVYESSKDLRRLYQFHGRGASCAWSSWGLPFFSAWELGFTLPPTHLEEDEIACPWVCRLIEEQGVKQGAQTVEEIAQAYKGGHPHCALRQVTAYARAVAEAYARLISPET